MSAGLGVAEDRGSRGAVDHVVAVNSPHAGRAPDVRQVPGRGDRRAVNAGAASAAERGQAHDLPARGCPRIPSKES